MSDRALYRTIPLAQRTCCYCQEPIQKNLLRSKDGRLWHYGCWNTARDSHYECQECYAKFDGTEANWDLSDSSHGDEFGHKRKAICPHCGAPIQNLSQRGAIEF